MPLVNVDAKSWHGNTIRSRFLDNIKDRTLKQRTRNRYSVKHLGKAAGREGGT